LRFGTLVALEVVEGKETAMYEIQIYQIVEELWRWEIRCDGTLLCCGTAHSEADAENEAREVISA
jgi:hypothetical protein